MINTITTTIFASIVKYQRNSAYQRIKNNINKPIKINPPFFIIFRIIKPKINSKKIINIVINSKVLS